MKSPRINGNWLGLMSGFLTIPMLHNSDGGHAVNEFHKDLFYFQRQQMIQTQLVSRDIRDSVVLEAMAGVPRHEFVPYQYRDESYADCPLSIGYSQTISQPYIVALMTQLAEVDSTSKVLEIGAGSGYQSAVLASIAGQVFSIEIVRSLCLRADSTLKRLAYNNIAVRCGDGYGGWPEEAPFDAVLVTAAPHQVPHPLVDQLKIGGRLVIPVGDQNQELLQIVKSDKGVITRNVIPVRFVPMTGEAEKR
jgi:protein-L-isoaspartate(D-aspartate) O-methyltransferase